MTTCIVLSDSHNTMSLADCMDERFATADRILHLGDGIRDQQRLRELYPDKLVCVRGNCDPYGAEETIFLPIEDARILMTHGHAFRVKSDTALLHAECLFREASCGLYGHTHIADIESLDSVTLINPGAWKDGNYCYLTVNGNRIFARNVHIRG